MSLGHDDIKHYTAQDFERYYSGQMSAQEMHALERAALDDPFLADALEGYKATRTPVADTAWLRQQLEGKTQSTRVVPLSNRRHYPLLRIAALVVFLLGAGWSVYYLMDSKKDTLALETPPPKTTTAEKATAPVASPDTAAEPVQPLTSESQTMKAPVAAVPSRKQAGKTTIKAVTAAPTKEAAPPAAVPEPSIGNVTVSSAPTPLFQPADRSRDVATVQRKQAAPSQALEGQAAGVQIQKDGVAPRQENRVVLRGVSTPNTFRGRVVDQNNQGVPNASVSLPHNKTGVTTNEEGYFSLNAPDTAVKASVAAIGYEVQNITLNRQNVENQVVLKPSEQNLSEVVVVGYGSKKKRSVSGAVSTASLPQPREGWAHFQTYVKEHRKPASELAPQGLSGSVTLSFDVSRKGAPTDIKVDTSLSPRYDEEAIRLLREGPRWERKKGTRGKVTIHFP